jgi:hypothetical protein
VQPPTQKNDTDFFPAESGQSLQLTSHRHSDTKSAVRKAGFNSVVLRQRVGRIEYVHGILMGKPSVKLFLDGRVTEDVSAVWKEIMEKLIS